MASPAPAVNGTSTPPAQTSQAAQPTPPTTQASAASHERNGAPAPNPALPSQPGTSLTDSGAGKRPRDARLIHLLLSSLGVKAYQDRVPLQLMDFAYRYTAGVLSDALALSAEGYGDGNTAHTSGKRGGAAAGGASGSGDDKTISMNGLRLAVQSRAQYQFQGALPKEFLLEMAAEKNKIPLPRPEREFGLRLPPERYCLSGVGWGLKEEWESEGEEDDDDGEGTGTGQPRGTGEDSEMAGVDTGVENEDVDQEEFEEVMMGNT